MEAGYYLDRKSLAMLVQSLTNASKTRPSLQGTLAKSFKYQ